MRSPHDELDKVRAFMARNPNHPNMIYWLVLEQALCQKIQDAA